MQTPGTYPAPAPYNTADIPVVLLVYNAIDIKPYLSYTLLVPPRGGRSGTNNTVGMYTLTCVEHIYSTDWYLGAYNNRPAYPFI